MKEMNKVGRRLQQKSVPSYIKGGGVVLCFFFFLSLGLTLGFIPLSVVSIMNGIGKWMSGAPLTPQEIGTLDILLTLRLPRMLLAMAVGVGLSLSGIVMQAIVRNPLADPYILGVSSGATLGAASAIFLGIGVLWGSQGVGIFATLGAIVASFLVVLLAKASKQAHTSRLLLFGMSLHMVFSSVAGLFIYLGKNKAGMESITYWMMGNLANARLESVLVLWVIVFFIVLYVKRQARILDLLLMGAETAITLGVDIRRYIHRLILVNGVLVGFLVYHAGMIGFLGLLVPHGVRALYGSSHKTFLLPALWIGGLFMMAMDIVSRTILEGVEVPIGICLSLLGAPVLFYFVIHRKYQFGGG